MNALYRGQRIDNGEWVEGNHIQLMPRHTDEVLSFILPAGEHVRVDISRPYGEYYVDVMEQFIEVTPETVGQWTGLKDWRGAKKYPGDIKRVLEFNPVFETLGGPQNGRSQVDTEIIVNIQEVEFVGDIATDWMNRSLNMPASLEEICSLFGLPVGIGEEEAQECILNPLAEKGVECKTLQEAAGFYEYDEIIGNKWDTPDLLEQEKPQS